MNPRTRRPRIACLIGYTFVAPEDGEDVDEEPIEKLLAKARRDGLVAEYDTGRCVWFNAAAGKKARALRDEVKSILPEDWTQEPDS